MKKTILILALVIFCSILFGQSSININDAVTLCGKGNYGVSLPKINFSDLDGLNCFPEDAVFDHYEVYKITGIVKGGTLAFDLTPTNAIEDIDFIVYKLSGVSPQVIRCMASGKSIDLLDAECGGPTGLAEYATDVIEYEGCEGGSDNYLRHLDVLPGEEYLIIVTNYKSGNNCELYLYGTAEFDQPHPQLIDSLELCQGYYYSLEIPKTKLYEISWELSENNESNFQYIQNPLSNRLPINTSVPGEYYYRFSYNKKAGGCEPVYSNITKVKIVACPSCENGIKDNDETDVDCGGAKCPQCAGCQILTDIELQDVTVSCDGQFYDTIPLIANYCNIYYDGQFSMEVLENGCTKEVIKYWKFDLPDTSVIFSQTTLIDRRPIIQNIEYAKDAHIQCRSDLLEAASLYYVEACTRDTIRPILSQIETKNADGDPIVRRFYLFKSPCSADFTVQQNILIKYAEGIQYDATPKNLVLSCEIQTPIAPKLRVRVNCETVLEPEYKESILKLACSTTYTRTYRFKLTALVDTTMVYTITKIDTVAPIASLIPFDSITFLCLNDTSASPLITSLDACEGLIMPQFSVHSNNGLGTKDSPLIFNKKWSFSDVCGNNTTLLQVVIVRNDEEILLPIAPKDTLYSCIDDMPKAPSLIATAGCGKFVEGRFSEIQDGNSCDLVVTRTWKFEYLDLKSKTIVQKIKIKNVIAPEFEKPMDVAIACLQEIPGVELGQPSNIRTTCNFSYNVSYKDHFTENTNCPGSGLIQREWLVKDVCGNIKTKTQYITTEDIQGPVQITKFPDITIACKADIPIFLDAFAIDSCTGDQIKAIRNEVDNGAKATPDDYLIINRTRSYKDACGNESTYLQTITVTGSTEVEYPKPPSNYNVFCLQEVGEMEDLVATNGCETRSSGIKNEVRSGDSCYMQITRSWTFSFQGLADTTILQQIIVSNNKKPEFKVPAEVNISCDDSDSPEFLGVPLNVATYCNIDVQINYEDQKRIELCSSSGSWIRTWKVSDGCGNFTTKDQLINYSDTKAPNLPSAVAPLSITCYEPAPEILNLIGQDNCDGDIAGTMISEVSNGGGGYPGNTDILTRTYEFKDGCGNTSYLYHEINVIGTSEVTVDQVPSDKLVSCQTEVAHPGSLRAVNDCGDEITVQPVRTEEGNLLCSGKVIYTWTFNFDGVAPISRSQVITIENSSLPHFTVPQDLAVSCDESTETVKTGIPTNIEFYCSAQPVITYIDLRINGSCPSNYQLQRTWTAFDRCDNVINQDQLITVRDTEAPQFTTLPSAKIDLNCVTDFDNLAISSIAYVDNCSSAGTIDFNVSKSQKFDETCINRFTANWVYTITDECGNNTDFEQKIVVFDDNAPQITNPPSPQNINCAAEEFITKFSDFNVLETCNGGYSIDTFSTINSIFDCARRFQKTRTYTVTDVCGNTNQYAEVITIDGRSKPTFTLPQPITIDCDKYNPGELFGNISGVTTACGGAFNQGYYDSAVPQGCLNNVIIYRTWWVEDDCGERTELTQNILLIDTKSPDLPSPIPSIAQPCHEPSPQILNLVAQDNCNGIIYSNMISTISNGGGGYPGNTDILTRTYEFKDVCGNASYLYHEINVIGTSEVTVDQVPSDKLVSCQTEVAHPGSLRAVNDCGDEITVQPVRTEEGNLLCSGKVIYTWTFNFDGVAPISRSQVWTIENSSLPHFTVPQDLAVSCDESTETVNTGIPTNIEFYCSAQPVITYSDLRINGSCPSNYQLQRTWTAVDRCDNVINQDQLITVRDTEAPQFTALPSAKIDLNCVTDFDNLAISSVAYVDNCSLAGSIDFNVSKSQKFDETCMNRFTANWIYTITDECGNNTDFEQKIVVFDDNAPQITNPPNPQNINCAAEEFITKFSDFNVLETCNGGYSIDTFSTINSIFDCARRFQKTRTYTVTDVCGNTNQYAEVITIDGRSKPSFTLPQPITIACDTYNAGELFGNISGVTTACGGTFNQGYYDSAVPQGCLNNVTIYRTWWVEDDCGERTELTQHILLIDTKSPDLPSPIPSISQPCYEPSPQILNLVAQDNCNGIIYSNMIGEVSNGGGGYPGNTDILTRTYEFKDVCGNTSYLYHEINVIGTSEVTVDQAPSDKLVSCQTEVAHPGSLRAVNDCGDEITVQPVRTEEGNLQCSGKVIYTWTFKFDGVAPISRSQVWTIENSSLPHFTVPQDLAVSCDESTEVGNTGYPANIETYCGTQATITYNDIRINGSCPSNYQLQRTWTAVDRCDNVIEQDQRITVKDTQAPVFSIEPARIVNLDCDDQYFRLPSSNVEYQDNCSSNNAITFAVNLGQKYAVECLNRFQSDWTYTIRDECGNQSEFTQHIIVFDGDAPEITNPRSPQSINCIDDEFISKFSDFNVQETCNGGYSIDTFSTINFFFGCARRFQKTRTYTITDVCGNSNQYAEVITIDGRSKPSFTLPQPITIDCYTYNAGELFGNISNVITACGGAFNQGYYDSAVPQGCLNNVTIYRTWWVEDDCGERTELTQNILLKDTQPPIFTDTIADLHFDCFNNPPLETNSFSADDNCNNTIISFVGESKENEICLTQYELFRTYQARDLCNNTTSFTQIISFGHNQPPSIDSAPLDGAQVSCVEELQNLGHTVRATDYCGNNLVVSNYQTIQDNKGSCENNRDIIRRFTISDACNNTDVYDQRIFVRDLTPPIITANFNNENVSCENEISLPITNPNALAYDNCIGSLSLTYNEIPASYICDGYYSFDKEYTITDECNNSSKIAQRVNVRNTTPPIITSAPSNLILNCYETIPSIGQISATHGCPENSSNQLNYSTPTQNIENNLCLFNYDIIRFFEVSDGCGNSSTHRQTINILSKDPPIFTAVPINTTVDCREDIPEYDLADYSASSSCGTVAIELISENVTSGSCASRFTVHRYVRATDQCGNTFIHVRTILVDDRTSPIINLDPVINLLCASEIPSGLSDEMSALDNCDGTITNRVQIVNNQDISYVCENKFTRVRTYSVSDNCGNNTTITQRFIINDTILPQLPNPVSELTVYSCGGEYLNNNTYPDFTGYSDNCGIDRIDRSKQLIRGIGCSSDPMIIEISYVVWDKCNNSSTYIRRLRFIDDQAPDFNIPTNITILCDELPPPISIAPSDNCLPNKPVSTSVVTNYISGIGSAANPKIYNRIYTANDACYNISKTQRITVRDANPPVISSNFNNFTVSHPNDTLQPPTVTAVDGELCSSITSSYRVEDNNGGGCANNPLVYTRIWTFTDWVGNISSTTQTINVIDIDAPSLSISPSPIDIPNLSCSAEFRNLNYFSNAAFDNWDGNIQVISHDSGIQGSGCPSNPARKYFTWTATDRCGNSATRSMYQEARDYTPPTFTAPPDVTLDCDQELPQIANLIQLNAEDCAGIADHTYRDPIISGEGNPDSPQIRYRIYTVTDACGNSSTATQVMTLIDENPGYVVGDTDYKCSEETTNLQAFGGSAYVWNTGSNQSSINVSPTNSTVYIAAITNNNGCTTYAGHEINVYSTGSISLAYTNYSVTASAPGATRFEYHVWVDNVPTTFYGPTLNFTSNMSGGHVTAWIGSCLVGDLNVSNSLPQCGSLNYSVSSFNVLYQYGQLESRVYYISCGSGTSPFRPEQNTQRAGQSVVHGAPVSCGGCAALTYSWNINMANVENVYGCYFVAKPGRTVSGSVTLCSTNNSNCCTTINF